MAGNSNSGRREASVKQKRLAVIDKAWQRAKETLDGKELTSAQVEMSKSIVVKSMPEQIENSGEVVIKHKVEIFDIEERIMEINKGRKCIGETK